MQFSHEDEPGRLWPPPGHGEQESEAPTLKVFWEQSTTLSRAALGFVPEPAVEQ